MPIISVADSATSDDQTVNATRRFAQQANAAEDAAWARLSELARLGVTPTDPIRQSAHDEAGRLTAMAAMAEAARHRAKALATVARADAQLACWSVHADVPVADFLALATSSGTER
jgi:hypothetical protein